MPHRLPDSLPPGSLPPAARSIPGLPDPMDFEATNPLPPMAARDHIGFERGVDPASTLELRFDGPAPLGQTATTLPAIGALSSRAEPPVVEVPPRIHRKRRLMIAGFVATWLLAAVGTVVWGVSWPALVGFVLGAYGGMMAHEVVLHRLLAHRAFRVSRAVRFILTAGAMMWPGRSPIWWAATHRHHHKFSDTDEDVHSPRAGRWRAFIGWPFEVRSLTFPYRDVGDLIRLPEMRLLDRAPLLPFSISLALCTTAGWAVGEMLPGSGMNAGQGLIWWGIWRALYPAVGMGLVNVFAHHPDMGQRPYETDDGSRNVRWLAWLTAGTGWHNNHHHYAHSARAGFRPGEFDPSYRAIVQLEKMGLAWDVREPPDEALSGGRAEAPAA